MKRLFCIVVTVALFFPLSVFSAKAVDCHGKAAVVMEWASETVLYEKNADEKLPQASTTKIMTALLVLESADLENKITVSASAAAVEGSQLGLTAGDVLSIRDLLYVLMLKSGNDAAEALAEGIGGSVSAFVASMNRRAKELGLNDTQFQNPHGLPAEGHYTTARDLARLTAKALENEEFCNIVSAKQAKLTYKNMVISNSNKLLETCEGVFGVKTGFTKKAGRCLVTAAERKGVRLICVTLNDGNDWQDHAALYDECFPRISKEEIVPARGYGGIVPILGGEGDATVKNSLPLTCITIDGQPIPYQLIPQTIPRTFAPIPRGQTLGILLALSEKGRLISSSPLNTVHTVLQKKEERTFFGSFPVKLRKLWRALTS